MIIITKIDKSKQPTFKMKIIYVDAKPNETNPESVDFFVRKVEENVRFLDTPHSLGNLGYLFVERFKIHKQKKSGKGLSSTFIGKKW